MIVKMSKVEIAGPRHLLEKVLYFLQDSGLLHIEPSTKGFIDTKDEAYIGSFLPDRDTLSERFFLEDLKGRVDELFSYLPDVPEVKSSMDPRPAIDTISETLRRHLLSCRELSVRKDALQKEMAELSRYNIFLDSIDSLLEGLEKGPGTDFIGLTLRDPDAAAVLKKFLTRHAEGKFELRTTTAADGTAIGLIAVDAALSDKIKSSLSERDIPELTLPFSFEGLTFFQKIESLRNRISGISAETGTIDMELDSFAAKWCGIYARVREWADECLSVLNAEGSVFETRMCFLIYGWMAEARVKGLGDTLNRDFAGKVVLEEMEVREEDLDRVPVMLSNPPYFKPFEIFTRILQLPRYTSYDPTPFIGIFFPVFFGMILGDAGYALVLMLISFFLLRRYRGEKTVADASRILMVSSAYTIFFGLAYGEFFGSLGHELFGLSPLLIERRTSIMPMLYFAVTVGTVHVLIGSVLGLAAAMRKKTKKEALCRSINLAVIILILLLAATLFGLFPALLTRPIILAILLLTPLLLFTGGLLAPLELFRSIGNIISYARIMAIGLTSVLLAFVANRLAGRTGDVITGIVVAVMLHLLNIVIGVFSPTVHSLRLHYVEFFSKFLEPGGRRFDPFRKKA